jgi:hypothetical protein
MENTTASTTTRWTEEMITELIRKVRNDLIKDFLDEAYLRTYYKENYNVKIFSPIKLEFLKKDLKELLISPVNKAYYQPVMKSIRENDSASLSILHEELFYNEIENCISKYVF